MVVDDSPGTGLGRFALEDLEIDLGRSGIDPAALRGHAAKFEQQFAALDAEPTGEFLRVVDRADLLKEIRGFVRSVPSGIRDVVQLGIGGSSLGGQALCRALLGARHNETVRKPGVRFHFCDNVDPESFAALLDRLDPRSTLVHVVSKSGGTLETAAQLHAVLALYRRGTRKIAPSRRFVATTGSAGPLRELAEREDIPILTFPEGVAGRYSVFTASGLLVPALCGVNVGAVLAGARRTLAACRNDGLGGVAGRLASVHYLHDTAHGRGIHVDFVYSDALLATADWFRQIWAESLGKAGRGPTPIVARGTTDQHSQVQLYMAGPDDKLYTLVRVRKPRASVRIPRSAWPAELAGRSFAEVFDAEAEGTLETLAEQRRPLIELTLPRVTPAAVGAWMMLRQLQTALAGALYGIDPFTQPGVEAGKLAAMKRLSRGSPAD